jgi:hypothetical protein
VIIVGGRFEVPVGREAEFVAGRVAVMARSRAEPGCITYAFAADAIEPGVVNLFERWESRDALDAHVAVLGGDPPPDPDTSVPVVSREVVVYDVTTAAPL